MRIYYDIIHEFAHSIIQQISHPALFLEISPLFERLFNLCPCISPISSVPLHFSYFQSISEPRVTLPASQSRVVTLRYYVPPSARAGDSATLLVSAVLDTLADGAAAHQTVTVLPQV